MSRFTDSLISQGYSREYAERVSDDRADRAYQEEKDRLSEEALRLRAAAPDLLAALRLMLREYECLRYGQPERWPEAAQAARAAIAKAAP